MVVVVVCRGRWAKEKAELDLGTGMLLNTRRGEVLLRAVTEETRQIADPADHGVGPVVLRRVWAITPQHLSPRRSVIDGRRRGRRVQVSNRSVVDDRTNSNRLLYVLMIDDDRPFLLLVNTGSP